LLIANVYLLQLKKRLSVKEKVKESIAKVYIVPNSSPYIEKTAHTPLSKGGLQRVADRFETSSYSQLSPRILQFNPILSRLAIGSAAGLLSGLFGMGGGIILVPFQMLLLQEPIKLAIQTSLGVIVGTAVSACVGHAAKGNVLFFEGTILGIGGLLGAQLSTRVLPKLPDAIVSLTFRGLLGVLSIYMFWQAWTQTETSTFLFMVVIAGGMFVSILAAIATLNITYKSIRQYLLAETFNPPIGNLGEDRLSIVPIERDRPSTRKWTTTVLLLLLAGQSSALLWTYRTAIAKVFADSAAAIASHLPKFKAADCMASTAIVKDRATYLQVCNAMQDVLNIPDGQFFYGGTMGAAALRSKSFLNEIRIAHPDFRLRYLDPLSVPPDSGTGIKMLINGELSFAESQRPLRESEYRQAQARGFILKQIPIAMTGAAFYTHPDLRLPGLSLNQLQAIYTGELTNWIEVGGPDLPIIPVSQDTDVTGSTLSLLMQDSPGDSQGDGRADRQTLSENIRYVRDTTAAVREVAATLGAIGFGTQAIVANQNSIRFMGLAKGKSRNYIQPISSDRQVNKIALLDGSYPLMQRVFVAIRQDGTLDEIAGTAYANLLLSQTGQALIDQAGYLPIRPNPSKRLQEP
jgi:phosphate transport system substrate-binding protein